MSFDSIFFKESSRTADLIIAFSARAVPRGKFTFWDSLHRLDVNVLFVNDHSTGWYLGGTPDFPDAQALTEHLVRHAAQARSRGGRVLMLGTSMGAYAALKYGSAIGADRIFAMGPESELCNPLGHSVTSLSGVREGEGDISRLQFRSPEDVLVVLGNGHIVDFYSACRFKSANPRLDVRLIENHDHIVAKYLDTHFGIVEVIDEFLLQGRRDFLARCELGKVVDIEAARAIKEFNEKLAHNEVDCSHSAAILKVAQSCPRWSFAQFFAGCLHEKEGRKQEAITAFRRSLASNPEQRRARFRLARLLDELGQMDEAIAELELLSSQSHSWPVGNALSRLYVGRGQYGMAIAALERSLALKLTPSQTKSVSMQVCRLAKTLLSQQQNLGVSNGSPA